MPALTGGFSVMWRTKFSVSDSKRKAFQWYQRQLSGQSAFLGHSRRISGATGDNVAVDIQQLAADVAELEKITQELERRGIIKPQSYASPFASEWDFLARGVWTRDEARGEVRQFPSWEYLRYLTDERTKYKVRAYEKSRRMMVTWWVVALYLYDIMTQRTHLNAVASDKLGKSAYLLGNDRMEFIYNHIPKDVWPNKPEVIFSGKEGNGWRDAYCPQTDSRIMAVASGESQMQQYTFTNVLMDEFPRWQWQEESWRNIQPTMQGGGCCDIICTAELGAYAYDLLYDQVRVAG